MTMLSSNEKQCFICNQTAEYPELMSTNTIGYGDLDFRPAEMKRSTMPYWAEECPFCGYVARDISRRVPFPKYVKQLVTSAGYEDCDGIGFKSDLAKRFFRKYFLAMEKDDRREALSSIHCAAWACDDTPDEEENAKKCRELALEVAPVYTVDDLAYADEEEESEDLIRADLLRRTGRFDEVIAEYSGKKYVIEKVHNSIVKYQVELASRHDDACHTVEEALAAFPPPMITYYSVAVGEKGGKSFYYLGDEEGSDVGYETGDRVVVPFGECARIGTIVRVQEFEEDDVPFEMKKTKKIIGRYDPTIDHSVPGYIPAATKESSGLISLLKTKKLSPEVYCSDDEGYEWLGEKELCLYVPNPYGDEPIRIRLGDDFTLMYRDWEKVYEYPFDKNGPGYDMAEAQKELARRNYRKLCEDLTDFLDTTQSIVLGYIEDRFVGGVLMNTTTAHRATEGALLSKITLDAEIVREANQNGARFEIESWMSRLNAKRTLEPRE